MQYAIVNGQKSEARKGTRGECPLCGCPTVAKCGPRVMHHWAHVARKSCDPWWENETEWHREWKGRFPEDCREVSHTAPDGEIHRADIKTTTGIVIEVQHSRMTDQERESREAFYRNLVWIVDGRGFRKSFHLGCMLPDPSLGGFEDIVWFQPGRSAYQYLSEPITGSVPPFWRISEAAKQFPGLTKANIATAIPSWGLVEVHRADEVRDQAVANYRGHHQFSWTRPRQTWLDARCPVYIDFGEDILYRLHEYDETRRLCVQLVAKEKLIHDAMVEEHAVDIATRFYPIA